MQTIAVGSEAWRSRQPVLRRAAPRQITWAADANKLASSTSQLRPWMALRIAGELLPAELRSLPTLLDLALLVDVVIHHDPGNAGVRKAGAGKDLADRDPQLRDGLRVVEDGDELAFGPVAQGGDEAMLAVEHDLDM